MKSADQVVLQLWGAPLQALIKDALTHDGPASIERIPDWNDACSALAARGLGLPDVIGTTGKSPNWVVFGSFLGLIKM